MDLRCLDKLVLGKDPDGQRTVKSGQSSPPFRRGVLDGLIHLAVYGRGKGRITNTKSRVKTANIKKKAWELHLP